MIIESTLKISKNRCTKDIKGKNFDFLSLLYNNSGCKSFNQTQDLRLYKLHNDLIEVKNRSLTYCYLENHQSDEIHP